MNLFRFEPRTVMLWD
uniref:Uncharacterized protein n=1 Tax=Anopheles minimus TaxID=112268 RepID=A0A182WPB1_9DIPT